MNRSILSRTLAAAAILTLAACSGMNGAAPGASSTPSKAPVQPLTDAKAVGAREFYSKALDLAKKDAADATLMRVDSQRGADFEAHMPPDGKAPHWLFTFGSKSKNIEISITASSVELKKIYQGPVTFVPESALPGDWVDSTAAFETAEKNGGADYRATHADLPVYYSLGHDGRLKKAVWTLRYSANPKQGLLFFLVDAVSGQFIEKQETKAQGTT